MDFCIQGLKTGEIAERLDLSISRVSTIMNGPNFKHQLAIRRAKFEDDFDEKVANNRQEAAEVLKRSAVAAAQRMVQLVDSESDSIAHRASSDILDRVGPQKRTGVETSQATINIDIDAAKLIEETLKMDNGAS
jgi:cell division septum initiation protein DivIVA